MFKKGLFLPLLWKSTDTLYGATHLKFKIDYKIQMFIDVIKLYA